MPWHTRWHDEAETTVLYEPEFPFTWKEFMEGIQAGQAMIESKPYIVDSFFVLYEGIRIPGSGALGYFREIYATDPANSGDSVVVSAPGIVQNFVNIITSVMGGAGRFHFVSTREEAEAILARVKKERAAS